MVGTSPLSARDQQALNKKQALAREYAAMRAGRFSGAAYQRDFEAFMSQYGGAAAQASHAVTPYCIPDPDTGKCGSSGSNFVALTQQSQANSYYCGPATAAEILAGRGVNKSQSFLAGSSYLKTDATGATSWNPYVMHPTLNTLLNTNWYPPVNGSGVGGGFDATTWEDDLQFDIDNGWAIAGNIVEYQNTDPHLVGHPRGLTIYHWIAIYGYTYYGVDTKYADSVSGDAWIWSWAANVPPYSSFASSDMTTLLNQRGVVY